MKPEAPFLQVCVWPATIVGKGKEHVFVQFMLDNLKVRVKYLEEVTTFPDVVNGKMVEGTGNRNDVLFGVHCEDVMSFAIPRLSWGISWLEDVLDNHPEIYPERLKEYL